MIPKQKALLILKDHQKWRKGCDETPVTNPQCLSSALDIAIETLEKSLDNGWIDIESAPKDEWILLTGFREPNDEYQQCEGQNIVTGRHDSKYSNKNEYGISYADGIECTVYKPTHWMPRGDLPQPPKSEG